MGTILCTPNTYMFMHCRPVLNFMIYDVCFRFEVGLDLNIVV